MVKHYNEPSSKEIVSNLGRKKPIDVTIPRAVMDDEGDLPIVDLIGVNQLDFEEIRK